MTRPWFGLSGRSSAKPPVERPVEKTGSSSWLGRFKPVARSRDPYLLELQKRRQALSDQYWQDKRRLTKKMNVSRRGLRRELGRRKEEAERYYRLHELSKDDERRAQAEHKAALRYERKERELDREHHMEWRRKLDDLQSRRDQARRALPKQIKREFNGAETVTRGDDVPRDGSVS